jgi:hypothetical protein
MMTALSSPNGRCTECVAARLVCTRVEAWARVEFVGGVGSVRWDTCWLGKGGGGVSCILSSLGAVMEAFSTLGQAAEGGGDNNQKGLLNARLPQNH